MWPAIVTSSQNFIQLINNGNTSYLFNPAADQYASFVSNFQLRDSQKYSPIVAEYARQASRGDIISSQIINNYRMTEPSEYYRLCLIFSLYKVDEPQKVADYLFRNSFLASILISAVEIIPKYFGSLVISRLSIFHDPEDGSTELFITIPAQMSFKEAMVQEDKLLEEWWLDTPSEARCAMSFDIEFL